MGTVSTNDTSNICVTTIFSNNRVVTIIINSNSNVGAIIINHIIISNNIGVNIICNNSAIIIINKFTNSNNFMAVSRPLSGCNPFQGDTARYRPLHTCNRVYTCNRVFTPLLRCSRV